MEALSGEFQDCLGRIEINGAKRELAIAAHTEVRAYLETVLQLVDWGIDTVLIGSYARRTAIYPGKDVDVFSKLTGLDTTASPRTVFDAFVSPLVSRYGQRATVQRRSIKVSFPGDFSVDVVPAVRAGTRWAIPSRDQENWGPGRSWMVTDPEKLTALTSERNVAPTVSERGAYVPTVKLIRQIREQHLGDAKPGGLYMELATYWVFEKGVTGDCFVAIIATLLQTFGDTLRGYAGTPLTDPALGTPYEPQPEPTELANASAVFDRLAGKAAQAIEADRCRAAVIWREIVGQNDRGPCFPIPEGCDERGNSIAPVTVNVGRGADEARGFGSDLHT